LVRDTNDRSERRTTMLTRVLSITAAVLSLTASVAVAEGLTDRLQATRMTALKIDREAGKFMCAEHRRWQAVSKAGLSTVHSGDIVRVDRKDGQLPRITVVRRASEELASPEM